MASITASTIAALGVAGLLYMGVKTVNKPRGIRNNNPGNIRHGQPWDGMAAVQSDDDYITFEAPEYGIRAMARMLRTYREQYGLFAVDQIINRWAPPSENDTLSYVNFVSQKLAVLPFVPLSFNDVQVAQLIAAIIRFENGAQPYSDAQLLAGIQMERAA